MPSAPRRTSKNRIHRRVAAATLATFALALGAVTFAGSPLPQTTSATAGTTVTTSTAAAGTTSSTAAPSSTSQPVSSSSSGQTSSATLTTGTS